MLKTRNYRNHFIEVTSSEVMETCYNERQAKDLIENLNSVIVDLKSFIGEDFETCDYCDERKVEISLCDACLRKRI